MRKIELVLTLALCAGLAGCAGETEDTAKPKLFAAATHGDVKTTETLLTQFPKLVNARDEYGATPLVRAVIARKAEIVELLLKKGADVSTAFGANKFTPIEVAFMYAKPDAKIVALLLENGVDPNSRGGADTPVLVRAVESGRKDIVELLLKKGADANAQERALLKFTALHHAVAMTDLEMTRLLLNSGAKPDITNSDGQTPLAMAEALGTPLGDPPNDPNNLRAIADYVIRKEAFKNADVKKLKEVVELLKQHKAAPGG